MRNKNKIFFLNRTSNYTYADKVDIVLSPELYWVRTFEIPVKSKKDILTIVPTLFEDFLDIEDYKFYTIALGENKHLCFAYSENTISQAIQNANLNLNQVSSIYFSQNEFKNLNSFRIEESYFIYQENTLIKVPKEFIDSDNVLDINLDTLNLSTHNISINKINKYVDNKSIYILSSIFLIISFINFGKTNIISNNIDKIYEHQSSIKKQYKMLPTMLQTKSIMKSLEKKEHKQIQLRNILEDNFNLKNKKIKKVSFRNGKVVYE